MSSPTPPEKAPKELSNEVRMLIAFVLMGLILLATPYVYRKLGLVAPESQKKASSAKTDPKAATTAGGAPKKSPPPDAQPPATSEAAADAVAAENEQEQVFDTQLYHVV